MLYSSIKFRDIELPNRWVMSPMCMYSAADGLATAFHEVHYSSRAQGGAGLIMVEATAVEPRGRITPKCLGIWNDEQAEALSKINKFIHENTASKTAIQLAHAGRKASTLDGKQLTNNDAWQTVAPSEIPYKPGEVLPQELSAEEIQDTVQLFRKAAERAVQAGFDIIEIHAAHGYLLHQFLSPLSNTRADAYGGSFGNRTRFLLETVRAVNEVLDEKHPLFVRISATEYAENGWDVGDSVKLAQLLKENGVDLVDVSSGGNIHGAKISVFGGYQVPFSAEIKKKAAIRTGAVGMITNGKQAEQILENGDADLIFVARELLRKPYLPIQYAFESGQECFFPPQYERAIPKK